MDLKSEFKDTVSFRLKPGLTPEAREATLASIRAIRGISAIEPSEKEPDAYNVIISGQDESGPRSPDGLMMGEDRALGIMDEIRWKERGNVAGVSFTPREQHELRARIAADQGQIYSPKI